MLTSDKLKELAIKNQTTELNIQREYVQHLFLSYFYQQKESKQIFFKGGTALRLIYNSPRFSEDLDFNSSFRGIEEIETSVINTLNEIEREGIRTEIVESKKTTGGYLAILSFRLSSQSVELQIEISKREKGSKGEVTTITNDFIPTYTIMQLEVQFLTDEKLLALLSRKKPRDFYDLYFMLRTKSLISQEQKKVLSKALVELKKTHINFEKELKQFLPKSHWAIIRDFKTTLEREINRFI